jgi:hypothetical protein
MYPTVAGACIDINIIRNPMYRLYLNMQFLLHREQTYSFIDFKTYAEYLIIYSLY